MLSIIIPTYNEESSIVDVVAQVIDIMRKSEILYELIVVNDGSSDNTLKVLTESNFRFRLIRHEFNEGYGAALKTGIKNAFYEHIALIDADGTYPANNIPKMLQCMKEYNYDMVVGARTGKKVNIPISRRPAKWIINKIAHYLSGREIPDLNSGLRIIKKGLVKKYMHILPNGFSFTTTITLAALTDGGRVGYIPIDYHKRDGKSKIRPIADTFNFITLIIRTVMYFNPLRIFVPLSLVLFIASFLTSLYRAVYGRGFGVISIILFVSAIQVLTTGMIADLVDKRSDKK